MGARDKPLLTRTDLIEAISRHFVTEMKVDHHDEIGKFLSLKREETRNDLTSLPGRPKPRQTRLRAPKPNPAAPAAPGATGLNNSNAPKQAAAIPGGKGGVGVGAVVQEASTVAPKTRTGGTSAVISTTGKRSTATTTPISTSLATD